MGVDATALLVLEYEHLKEEQRLRIGTRDNLIYATLGALALVVAGMFQTGRPAVLLLVPPVCVILGWTYLVNDDRITAIGRHIEEAITPGLASVAESGTEIFAWERSHRSDRRRRSRKAWQLMVDLLTFIATSLVALAIVARLGQPSPLLLGIGGADLVATVLLAYQIFAHTLRTSTG